MKSRPLVVVAALSMSIASQTIPRAATMPNELFSGAARTGVVHVDGWTVGIMSHLQRGYSGGNEGVCFGASTARPRPGGLVRDEVVATVCRSHRLASVTAKARWFTIDSARGSVTVAGTFPLTRVDSVGRWNDRTGEWDSKVVRRRVENARISVTWRPPDDGGSSTWWAGSATSYVDVPLCFTFLLIPCLRAYAAAGYERSASVAGIFDLGSAGRFRIGDRWRPLEVGRLAVFLTATGPEACEGRCA